MSKFWTFTIALAFVFSTAFAQDMEELLKEDDFEPPPPPSRSFEPKNNRSKSFNRGGSRRGGTKPVTSTNPSFNKAKKRRSNVSIVNPEDITNENFPEMIDSFDYPNADIADVVKAISELTGLNFIIDPGLRGKVTIIAPSQITVAEAYKAFLSTLAINGYSVVPAGKFLKIKQSRPAQRDSIEIYSGAYTPNTDQMITRIIQLKYISAEEVNKNLRGLTTKDGELQVYSPTNTLIVSDYGSNVHRIMKIISHLDIQGFEDKLEVIPVRHAKAKDLAELIDQIINKGQGKKSGRSFRSGIPRFRRGTSTGKTGASAFSMIIPDERTNALIVVGNKAGIAKIRKLIKQLDYELNPEDAGGAYVYYVKYGEAKKIADTLMGVAKAQAKSDKRTGSNRPSIPSRTTTRGATLGSKAGGIFSEDVKITADETTNSLIIVASKQDYQSVVALLNKIDIPRDQVYVEAIIMEMGTSKTQSWSLSYYNFADESGLARQGFSDGNMSSLLDITGGQGLILGFGAGDTVKLDIPNIGEKEVKSLTGFLNILKGNADINILSRPQLIAIDNEEAIIEVGEVVPVGTTQNATASGSSTSVTREPATIKLKVQPFISPASSSVRLKVTQDIKQLSAKQVRAKNLADSSVITTTRSIDTNIVVHDGDTAVLGGLMREEENVQVRKVPLLGDIPLIGWLFKSSNNVKEKINLLVFLTPRIIRSKVDSMKLTNEKINHRIKFLQNNAGGRDPFGDTVEEMLKKQEAQKAEQGTGYETETLVE
jgi:general secretion pathway protein D